MFKFSLYYALCFFLHSSYFSSNLVMYFILFYSNYNFISFVHQSIVTILIFLFGILKFVYRVILLSSTHSINPLFVLEIWRCKNFKSHEKRRTSFMALILSSVFAFFYPIFCFYLHHPLPLHLYSFFFFFLSCKVYSLRVFILVSFKSY